MAKFVDNVFVSVLIEIDASQDDDLTDRSGGLYGEEREMLPMLRSDGSQMLPRRPFGNGNKSPAKPISRGDQTRTYTDVLALMKLIKKFHFRNNNREQIIAQCYSVLHCFT